VVVPGDSSARKQDQKCAAAPEEGPLVKLLARAFYWKRLFDSGDYATLEELAAAENVDRSYLSKTLRLTLLAPSLMEAILEGRQPGQLTIEKLMAGVPTSWREQAQTLQTP
jgi:hypothetical protein